MPPMPFDRPPRGAASLLAALVAVVAATCGGEPLIDEGATATASATSGEASTSSGGASTSTGVDESSTDDAGASTGGTTVEATTSSDATTMTSDATTSDTTDATTTDTTTTTTGADDPPPDPCAKQDKPPPDVGARKALNDDPRFIQVYVNNVENLKLPGEQCPGEWTDLIAYMKTVKPSPDLFLVSQVSDAAQLDLLVKRMTDDLPGAFAGVIADADPWTQGSPCGKEKAKQTNAVIYRTGRFTKVGPKHVWQAWANTWSEANDNCVRNNQARTRGVMIKLHDDIADKVVTVASLHWSTSQGGGPDPACAKKNVLEVDEKLHKSGFGGDLVIFGGDFNEPDRKDNNDYRPWYAAANGDKGGALNYRDPIFRACQQADKLHACLDDHWTGVGSFRRIDMLFAKTGAGCRARSDRAHTITFDEADEAAQSSGLNYSDHRAVRAEFYY